MGRNGTTALIGEMLGHCRGVAKIGEGGMGMGVVYRAHDEALNRDVALKVVRKGVGPDSSASQDLLREARASSSLSHPNICIIHEVAGTDGELCIVMELVQIASALGRAHVRGIVHRDLKTANILVTPEGLVKVLDFGLAKHVGAEVLKLPLSRLRRLKVRQARMAPCPIWRPRFFEACRRRGNQSAPTSLPKAP